MQDDVSNAIYPPRMQSRQELGLSWRRAAMTLVLLTALVLRTPSAGNQLQGRSSAQLQTRSPKLQESTQWQLQILPPITSIVIAPGQLTPADMAWNTAVLPCGIGGSSRLATSI